jgi:hypothetical protein
MERKYDSKYSVEATGTVLMTNQTYLTVYVGWGPCIFHYIRSNVRTPLQISSLTHTLYLNKTVLVYPLT